VGVVDRIIINSIKIKCIYIYIMPGGVGRTRVGGNQGRPSDQYGFGGVSGLRACVRGPQGIVVGQPCTEQRNIWTMIMTNDWFYQKGNVNSTTGSAVTGGALAARRRRT
jgi:hypothetical protein